MGYGFVSERFASLLRSEMNILGILLLTLSAARGQPSGVDLERIASGQSITLPAAVGTDHDILGRGFDAQLRDRDASGATHRVHEASYTEADENRFEVDVDIIENQTQLGAYARFLIFSVGAKQTEHKRYAILRVARIKRVATLRENLPTLDSATFVASRVLYGWAVYHVIEGDETNFSQNVALSIKKLGIHAGRVIKENGLHVKKKYIGLNPIEESDSDGVITDESILEQQFRDSGQPAAIAVEYRALKEIPARPIRWANSRLRPGPYRLKTVSVRVADTKSDGSPWDILDGPPDPFVEVILDGKRIHHCFKQDSFKVECSSDRSFTIKEDSEVRVIVTDRDPVEDDAIGEARLSNLLKHGVAYDEVELQSTSSQLERVAIRLVPLAIEQDSQDNSSIAAQETPSTIEPAAPVALRAPQKQLIAPLPAPTYVQPAPTVPPFAPPHSVVRTDLAPFTYPSGLRVQRVAPGWGPQARPGPAGSCPLRSPLHAGWACLRQ